MKTAKNPETSATPPASNAENTFCLAAIATTIGMYMALQKVIPFSVIGGSKIFFFK